MEKEQKVGISTLILYCLLLFLYSVDQAITEDIDRMNIRSVVMDGKPVPASSSSRMLPSLSKRLATHFLKSNFKLPVL